MQTGKTAELLSESPFPIHSYGKGELASLYLPNVCQQTAVNRFNKWIRTSPGLEQRLMATGLRPTSRHYTPAQVKLIVDALGEP
ncbi:DUF4248 domain-containing protein [Bacteroides heparinolyticus]|uniref:DUF4248 domain-containing protein n=1 Tax=Prevotella heparinolytica TaxID=28113 RepID=A0A3P2A7C0_9BACE|nr:DUF4248 domain-containing protein [Bacteroides heparinolyticus]MCF0257876.1 DUF4248 domain-containing protein [Bacteroides heparinolyticus]RRD90160.1 DUF4248 domain-containing protein [Bacteroides heparinolyticus]VFB14939.1 Uncharacterised protein [Bacteroides heparinolyticus]